MSRPGQGKKEWLDLCEDRQCVVPWGPVRDPPEGINYSSAPCSRDGNSVRRSLRGKPDAGCQRILTAEEKEISIEGMRYISRNSDMSCIILTAELRYLQVSTSRSSEPVVEFHLP